MKVKIKNYRAVGYWVWDTRDPDDVCGICQSNFDGCCATCKEPGDACPLLFGECTHEFHMHCIFKWLEGSNNPICPLCKRPWVVQSKESQEPAMPSIPGYVPRITMTPAMRAAAHALMTGQPIPASAAAGSTSTSAGAGAGAGPAPGSSSS
ncbi:ubiquitin-protein ligase Anaphase Promoting Complex [Tilletia horrida]|nr:ubiquitin-protein ligase Anaphase Promoting Complex [Tilletia horrida]